MLTRENLPLCELQFPECACHRAAPDQVSHDHEPVAAQRMVMSRPEDPQTRHDPEVAHGPDQEAVGGAWQNAASRSEQRIKRAGRGAIAEVRGQGRGLPPLFIERVLGRRRERAFNDLPRRQGIALRRAASRRCIALAAAVIAKVPAIPASAPRSSRFAVVILHLAGTGERRIRATVSGRARMGNDGRETWFPAASPLTLSFTRPGGDTAMPRRRYRDDRGNGARPSHAGALRERFRPIIG